MPRRRYEIDRDDKVIEMVSAAQRQLLDGGYGALSLAAIARELGIAQNSIYWYFPSRDHLFVAALRNLVADFATRKPSSSDSVSERAVWIVNRLAEWHPLIAAMHERSRHSPTVAEFNGEVEAALRGMILRVLSPYVAEGELDIAADAFWAGIEGALLRQLPRRRREAVVRYTLRQFIGDSAASESIRTLHARGDATS